MSLPSLFQNQKALPDMAAAVPPLLAWFERHKRPLPWRTTYAPYDVWISEMMLQQTQMERGVAYYKRWMERFPTLEHVAEASEEDILHAWEGLGYYRRARFLHATAKAIMSRHQGRIPDSETALLALPGLGPYTVAAILGIAFNQNIATIDANVDRVFARLYNIDSPPRKQPAAGFIHQEANRLLPQGQARQYNQALMELGALICRKIPQCPECPLQSFCRSRAQGVELARPVLEAKSPHVPVQSVHGLLIQNGQILLRQRPAEGVWGNLWECPGNDNVRHFFEDSPRACPDTHSQQHTIQQALVQSFADLGLAVRLGKKLATVRHSYTNHRLSASFFQVDLEGEGHNLPMPQQLDVALAKSPHLRLIPWESRDSVAMPAHHRKVLSKI